MNRSAMKLLAGAAALGLFVAAPAVAEGDGDHDPQEAKNQAKEETTFCDDEEPDDNLTVTVNGDDVMWPPNHKYQDVILTAVDTDGGTVTLDSSAYHDEYLDDAFEPAPGDESANEPEEEQGAGNTVDDAKPFLAHDEGDGEATTTHELRSERSGRGNGRTYTIEFHAQTDGGTGGDCTGTYEVTVPHDMGNGAENKKDHTEG